MEPQTRFDLTQAIAQWRHELLARPGLEADEVKELESHLCEHVSSYVAKGIGEQDAFWLAKRHLGSSDELVGEFMSANPQRAWSERMLWIVFGIAGFSTWNAVSTFVVNAAFIWSAQGPQRYESNWPGAIASFGLAVVFACLVLGASQGRFFARWRNDRLQLISTWAVGLWLGLQMAMRFYLYRETVARDPGFAGAAAPLIFRHVAQLMVPAVLFGWLLMEIRRSAMAEKARA